MATNQASVKTKKDVPQLPKHKGTVYGGTVTPENKAVTKAPGKEG